MPRAHTFRDVWVVNKLFDNLKLATVQPSSMLAFLNEFPWEYCFSSSSD
jgi:hypothetical protein